MDRMITTLAEMPAVAGRTRKSIIGEGKPAQRFSRWTCGLATCLGLLFFGQNAHAGIIGELLSYMGEQVVEWATDDALTSINDTDRKSVV